MRRGLFRAGALAAMLAGAFLALPGSAPAGGPGASDALGADAADGPGFEVLHYLSAVDQRAFREVFIVHGVDDAFEAAPADVEIRRDGEPLAVAWEDVEAPGRVSDGDRFWFVQEAFDQKQVLTGHLDGRQVMDCRFGGGAALGFTPDQWRAMGQPEMVRCLLLTDDQ